MKKSLLAAAVSAFLMFGLAGIYTRLLAHDFIQTEVAPALLRAPANLALVFAGYLGLALLMTSIYQRTLGQRPSSAWSGWCFGMVSAVCWMMPYSLVLFGVYAFPYAALPMDFGWALLEQGTGGLVIGLILNKVK